jgi:hypothetical protein
MLDKRVGRKQSDIYDRNLAPGVRIDAGPYEAVVKNVVDPARHGRLQVFIPELGANNTDSNSQNPDDPTFWRTVSYATPFYGVVDPNTGKDSQQTAQNQFGYTKQSYGMWFVPPDPGTTVLVMFVNGDPNRGYWIACVPDGTSHYMTPGLASSDHNTDTSSTASSSDVTAAKSSLSSDITSAVSSSIPSAVSNAIPNSVSTAVSSAIASSPYSASFASSASSITNSITSQVQAAAANAVNTVTGVANQASSIVNNSLNAATNLATHAVSTIESTVNGSLNTVVAAATSGLTSGTTTSSIANTVSNAVSRTVTNAVNSSVASVLPSAVKSAISAANTFTTIPNSAITALSNSISTNVSNSVSSAVSTAVTSAASSAATSAVASSPAAETLVDSAPKPVVEFNDKDDSLATKQDFLNNPHPLHTVQYQILQTQGLDKDTLRGTTTSSSQRDIPSSVFGISSPGRRYPDLAQDPQFAQNLQNGTYQQSDFDVTARQGGHTFVMDDGDVFGDNQLFRLRSATGHQFLMHDNGGVVYIANAKGTVWIELTNVGDFNMFVQGDFNLHANGSLNMKFDKDVRIDAGGNFQVNAQGNLQLQGNNLYTNVKADTNFTSAGNLLFKAGGQLNLSSGAGTNVSSPGALNFNASHIGLNDGGGVAVESAPSLPTPVSQKSPTHEPWTRPIDPNGTPVNTNTEGQAGSGTNVGSTNSNGQTPSQDATKDQSGKGVKKGAPLSVLQNQPSPVKAIGTLTTSQTQSLLAQIGYNESGSNYSVQGGSNGHFLGKYQIGAGALVDQGYISPSAYKAEGNGVINDPSAWTGQNGINSAQDFLNNPSVQERAMTSYAQNNYNAMIKNGAIQPGDDPGTVGGMLQVAHLLGASGANTWRNTGSGSDAFGTTGSQYFNQGRYGVTVLGSSGQTSS